MPMESLDTKTLMYLMGEARKNLKCAADAFEKHDNAEDMREMETWSSAVEWLEREAAASIEHTDATLADRKAQFEAQQVALELSRAGGNQTHAAKTLGISRRTIINLINRYGIGRQVETESSQD